MRKSAFFLSLFFLLTMTGCMGEIFIEKTKAHRKEATAIKKVIYIEPSFERVTTSEKTSKVYGKESKTEEKLTTMLQENAKRCTMEAVVIDGNTIKTGDVKYFNVFAPLRKKIYLANFTQDIKSTWKSYLTRNEVGSKTLKRAPIFSSEYSYLAQEYGTPYFGVQGIATVRKPIKTGAIIGAILFPPIGVPSLLMPHSHTYFYHIVVNVETAEVVYREIRYFNNTASEQNINMVMYDSFRILTKK